MHGRQAVAAALVRLVERVALVQVVGHLVEDAACASVPHLLGEASYRGRERQIRSTRLGETVMKGRRLVENPPFSGTERSPLDP
jgi:hypothetical protein